MTVLRECIGLWGEAHLMYGDPPTRALTDAIYVPHTIGRSWGIFDSTMNAVEESIDFRGRERDLRDRDLTYPSATTLSRSEDRTYLYCGNMSAHFGHFLVNTLSRLWPEMLGNTEVLLLYHGNVMHALQQPFVKTIFGGLNIDPSRIRSFDRPTRIGKLIVPASCFHEQFYCYTKYGDVCRQIGQRLLATCGALDKSDVPVYFSKTRLSAGVGRFAGEGTVEAAARKAGLRVVYPEELTFAQQLRVLREHKLFVGCTGSVFHNEVFVDGGIDAIVLNNIPDVNSNFTIMDLISRSRVAYFHPQDLSYAHNVNGFLTETRTPHMAQVAQELMQMVEARASSLRAPAGPIR